MSERPASDSTAQQAGAGTAGAATAAASKAADSAVDAAVSAASSAAGPAPRPKTPVTGVATYPDGFQMEQKADGSFTLTSPDGQTATWDAGHGTWMGDAGTTMPDDWSAGHYPGSQGDSGPGSPAAHPDKTP